jgi:hypothetical protein
MGAGWVCVCVCARAEDFFVLKERETEPVAFLFSPWQDDVEEKNK